MALGKSNQPSFMTITYLSFRCSETPLVPSGDGSNLYIRPTLLETSEGFGIKDDAFAAEALLYVVTTTNLGKGLYASAEGKGIKLDACKEFIRAWPGGTGSYKLGANYGELNDMQIPLKRAYATPCDMF